MGSFVAASAEPDQLSHVTGRISLRQADGIEVRVILALHLHEVCNFMLVLSARCSVLSMQRQVYFQLRQECISYAAGRLSCKEKPRSCSAGRHAEVMRLVSCGHRRMLVKCQ